jgi:hypothetical protein
MSQKTSRKERGHIEEVSVDFGGILKTDVGELGYEGLDPVGCEEGLMADFIFQI